jgi:hypothetical protein
VTRAADDFGAIRARLEELQRERVRPLAGDDAAEPVSVLRPGATFRAVPRHDPGLSPTMRRLFAR